MPIKLVFPEDATPLHDCSGLIPEWVLTQADLNRAEAENILYAERLYLRRRADPARWFTPLHLQTIHRSMFGRVWAWAGSWRRSVTSIGCKPALIPSRLSQFCQEVNHRIDPNPLVNAVRIHHGLVRIHPFENGNGRFSRLVADRYLVAHRCTRPIWPINLQESSVQRRDYIASLRAADQGDFLPLLELMRACGASEHPLKPREVHPTS